MFYPTFRRRENAGRTGEWRCARVNWETEVLLRHLDAQRQHVFGILDGLSEDQLRRPVLPSGWHCLGLIKHLARSDEHYWFRCVVAGEPFDVLPLRMSSSSTGMRFADPTQS